MNLTVEQCKEIIESLTGAISELETKIQEDSADVAKSAKKGDYSNVKYRTQWILKRFEQIEEYKSQIEQRKEDMKAAERETLGHGPIMEFLNGLYEKDLKWFDELKADYKEKGNREYIRMVNRGDITKTVYGFATMTRKEAEEIFKKDIEIRYAKIVATVEKKIGKIQEIKVRRNPNYGFDGLVTGTDGRADLYTVLAGGYNIQRLHYRTMVNVVKN
jgi:hypothetical protein